MCQDVKHYFYKVEVVVHYHGGPENEIELFAKWEDISLRIGQSTETEISPYSPATFLFDQTHETDYDEQVHFELSIEAIDPLTEGVYMIVAAYTKTGLYPTTT